MLWADIGPHARGLFTTHSNRNRAQDVLGAPVTYARQVHGSDVLGPREPEGTADAVLGTDRGVGVLVADCVPVLLAANGAVAAVHAGRRGVLSGVVQAAIRAMRDHGFRPTHATIGPAICGQCYEVPAQMREEAAAQYPRAAARTRWGTPSIDLPVTVHEILRDADIGDITRVPMCTYEDHRFPSFRRDGTSERFAGMIIPVSRPPAATRRSDLP